MTDTKHSTISCLQCGNPMPYLTARGEARTFCSRQCVGRALGRTRRRDLLDAFLHGFERIAKPEIGCWEWASGSPYGQVQHLGKVMGAHRMSYWHFIGPIPDGLVIDHLCRNPRCVRPDHLDVVPPHINNLRGASPSALNARKTQCHAGHPFNETNTLMKPNRRYCRICRRIRDRRRIFKGRKVVGRRPADGLARITEAP